MVLIADSGSTKTTWSLQYDKGEWKRLTTQGMNPLTAGCDSLEATLQEVKIGFKNLIPRRIHFYGAGCGTPEPRETLLQLFRCHFPQAVIEIQTDLLAACRALSGSMPSLVGILGTGSNICFYDGSAIQCSPHSLGYLLGDEGSGVHIGSMLLKDYLREVMPEELRLLFHEQYAIHYDQVIQRLYRSAGTNRFLASFAPFAQAHRTNPYIASLLGQAFEQYLELQVAPLHRKHPICLHLIGSIAHIYHNEIAACAQRHGIILGKTEQEPIDGLERYHDARQQDPQNERLFSQN